MKAGAVLRFNQLGKRIFGDDLQQDVIAKQGREPVSSPSPQATDGESSYTAQQTTHIHITYKTLKRGLFQQMVTALRLS